MHFVHNSTIYKCALINTTGNIADSVEQHVSVEGKHIFIHNPYIIFLLNRKQELGIIFNSVFQMDKGYKIKLIGTCINTMN